MSNRMSALEYQPVNGSGDVLPGAQLTTYFSGTTTPITTYQDDDLTVAHTNPIVAGSDGRFPEIFLSAAEHRMVLTDSNDVQIDVFDPVIRVESIPSFSGNTVENFTATAGQTLFTLSSPYILGINGISVYINGVLQFSPDNYLETSTTEITFTSPLEAGDLVVTVVPNVSSLLVNIGTANVSLVDDSFTTITPPETSGMIEIFTEVTDNAFGKFYYEVATPFATEAFSASLFDVTTGVLTGTSGVDGRVTASAANDGKIYLENRLGSTKTFVYSFIVKN